MCEPESGPLASDRARDRHATRTTNMLYDWEHATANIAALTEALEQAENAREIAQADAWGEHKRTYAYKRALDDARAKLVAYISQQEPPC